MFNVMGQEFGHCLGLSHVGSQGGVDPTSDLKHPEHDIMNGFYTHFIGDKGTHLHCISNLDILALEYVFTTTNPSPLPSGGPSRTTYMPVAAYGTTCELPPSNWRQMSGAGPTTTPPAPSSSPSPVTSPQPQPQPGPTSTPSPSPTPAPAPSASPTPSPTPTPGPSPSDGSQQAEGTSATTTIEAPLNGASIPRRSFRSVSGSTSGEMTGGTRIQVALVRRVASDGCRWWSARGSHFVTRACTSPRWNKASGLDEWSFSLPSGLPRGRYRAFSRAVSDETVEECCHRGDNLIDFRLI
jgi:hypothetical protein